MGEERNVPRAAPTKSIAHTAVYTNILTLLVADSPDTPIILGDLNSTLEGWVVAGRSTLAWLLTAFRPWFRVPGSLGLVHTMSVVVLVGCRMFQDLSGSGCFRTCQGRRLMAKIFLEFV